MLTNRTFPALRYMPRLLLGTVLAASSISVCNAAETDVRQETVKFADVNVASPQGAAVLLKRIKAAARHVCSQPGDRDLEVRSRVDACVTLAVSTAVGRINQPTLTELYRATSGNGIAPIVVASAPVK